MAGTTIDSNSTYNGSGGQTVNAGDYDTITLSGGNNNVTGGSHDNITIYGGGNTVSMQDYGQLTINDSRTEVDGFTGSVDFADTVSVYTNDTVTLNYSLTLGSHDTVSVDFNPNISQHQHLLGGILGLLTGGGTDDTINEHFAVSAGGHDTITFAGPGEAVTLTLGSGDTLTTSGSNDTITIAGSGATKSTMTIGATASGTTINGGLGTDTFTAGSGYDGGNHFIGSAQSNANGFNAIGSCANYSGLASRLTVNLNTGFGQGFDANGNQLWTDTYTTIEQVKAGQLNGNILTGSDSFFCELKGGLGSTTYYGGGAGDRIVWSEAGATGLLDGKATDVAHGGAGADEFYWRNSPGGKGVSNFGEAIYGFNPGQGDDLNLSEFADSGFAGVTNAFTGPNPNLFNWVDVSLAANGQDTDVWFDKTGSGNFQLAAVLKGESLFAAYGVNDTSNVGAQQVVQDMYNAGALVLTHPH